MIKFRGIAFVLVILMVLSLFQFSVYASANYSDTGGHWAKEAIDRWSGYGVIRGDGATFRPDAPITRGEMAAILDNLMRYHTKADNSFSDLDENWYTDPILKVNSAGIMVGGDGKVRPKDNITRQEATVLICRALDIPENFENLSGFVDSKDIGSWALGYVNAMTQLGYISGVGGNRFVPRDNITRAAAVTILDNAIKAVYQKEGTYTGNVNGIAVVSGSGSVLKDMNISGDIIVAEGVGDGEVVLDSVKVEGTMIIRGGGANSIIIKNSCVIPKILVNRRDGVVAVKVEGDSAEVGHISVLSNGAVISAPMATVAVAEGVTGALVNGKPVQPGETVLAIVGPKDDVKVSPSIPVPTITANSDNGSSRPRTTPVEQDDVTAIALDTEATTMNVAEVIELTPILTPLDSEAEIRWTSSNSEIASVNSDGLVMAAAEGEVTITAKTGNNLTASCLIAVSAPEELVVNYPGTVINGGTYANITIGEDVGEGDVSFNDITVTGTLTVNGGGSASIHFNGNSHAKDVVVSKTSGETPRFLMNNASSVTNFNVSGNKGAILEKGHNATGKVSSVNATKPLKIKNAEVHEITTSSDLELYNGEVTKVTTTGELATINLKGETKLEKLEAGTKTTINADSSSSKIEEIYTENAEIETNEKADVGLVKATGTAKITVKGPTKHIDANGGDISVMGNSSPVILGLAGMVSIGGNANPILTADANTIEVTAGGSAGITVTGTVSSISTTGTGSIGSINIEKGNPTVNIDNGIEVGVITVAGSAAPVIEGAGSTSKLVSTSTGTVTVNANTTTLIAEDADKVNGSGAENVQVATVTLNSISLTAVPSKLVYKTTDTEINNSGMIITGNYSVTGFDGFVKKTLSAEDYDITGWPIVKTAGNHTITVTKDSDKKVTFQISIVAKEVESISLNTLPTKLSYGVGEELDLTGGKLTVYHTNKALYPNEIINLPNGSVTVTGYTSTAGTKSITLQYNGKAAKFSVSVKDLEAEALAKAKLLAEIDLRQVAADLINSEKFNEAVKAVIASERDSGISKIKAATTLDEVETIKNATIEKIMDIRIVVGNVGYSDLQTAINAASSNQTVEIIMEYTIIGEEVTVPSGKKVVNRSKFTISDEAALTVERGAVLTNEGSLTLFGSEIYNEELDKVEIYGSCLSIEEGGTLNLNAGSDVMTFHGGDYIKLEVNGTLNAQEGTFIIVLGGSVTGIEGIETGFEHDPMNPHDDGTGVYGYNGTSWNRLDTPNLDGFDVSIKADGNMVIHAKALPDTIEVQVDDGAKRLIDRDGVIYLLAGQYNDGKPHKIVIRKEGMRDLLAFAMYIDKGKFPNLEEMHLDYEYQKYYEGGKFITVAGEVEVSEDKLLIPEGVIVDIVNGGSIDLTDKELEIKYTVQMWAMGGKSELIVRNSGSITLEDGKTIGGGNASDVKLGNNNYFIIGVNEPEFTDNPEEEPVATRKYVAGGMGTIEIPLNKSFILNAGERMEVEPDTTLFVNGALSPEDGAILVLKSDMELTASVKGSGTGIAGIIGEGEYIWTDGKWEISKRFKANRLDVIKEIFKNFKEGYGLRMPKAGDITAYSGQYTDWSDIEESDIEPVAFMIKNKMLQGNEEGELDLYGKINRAGLMIILDRLIDSMGIELEGNDEIEFTDVSETDYFYEAVMTMAKAHVVNGMPNGPESDTFCFMPYESVGIEPLDFEGGKSELEIVLERFKGEVIRVVVNRFELMRWLYDELKREEYLLEGASPVEIDEYASRYDDWDELHMDWLDESRFETIEEQNAEYEAMAGLFVKYGIIDEFAFGEENLLNLFEPLTKAEIMAFLDMVSKVVLKDDEAVLPTVTEIVFEDVVEADWFYGGVMNMARAGVVEGIAIGTEPETFRFYPYSLVSRRDFGWGPEQIINMENYFRAFETVMPKTDVIEAMTYTATSGEFSEMIKNIRFKEVVNVTGEPEGRIDFANCEFEKGLTVTAGERFEVNLGRSVVQDVYVNSEDETLMFDDNSEVFIRDIASGTNIYATNARAAVECRVSGGYFTLNGAVIRAGEFDENPMEYSDDNLFHAALRWRCLGDHGDSYEGNHIEHVGQSVGESVYQQAPTLEFRGVIDLIEIDDEDEFVGFDMQGNTRNVILNITKSTPVAGGEINMGMPNPECDKRLIVTGNVSGNNLTLSGRIDVSGLVMGEENMIRIGAWAWNTNVAIGTNTVYVVSNENLVPISAEPGAKVIITCREPKVDINSGALDVGQPHIFEAEGNYQIYLGRADSTDFTFTLKQGEATLEYQIDNQYADIDGKLHLIPEEQLESPEGISLEVQKDGITVIYENLELK